MYTKKFAKKYHDEGLVEKELVLLPVYREILDQRKWKKLVDLGCGSGYYARMFVEKTKEIVGIDANVNQLNIAKKIEEETKQGINYIKADLTNLKFVKSNSFDVAFLSFVIIEVSDEKIKKKIFKEAYRILKKGGVLIIGQVHPHAVNRKGTILEKMTLNKKDNYFSEGAHAISKALLKNGKYLIFKDDYHYTLEFLLNNLKKSGFILNTLRELSYKEPYPSHVIIVEEK